MSGRTVAWRVVAATGAVVAAAELPADLERVLRDYESAWEGYGYGEGAGAPDMGRFLPALRRGADGVGRIAADLDSTNRPGAGTGDGSVDRVDGGLGAA